MKVQDENIVDLKHKDAIDKIKELVGHNGICLFTTNLSHVPLNTRPMATLQVDEEGALWFLSLQNSEKNEDILADPRVQLFYSNEKRAEFLSVYGLGSVVYNKEKINELWTPMASNWVKEGKDDPQLTCIKVLPEEAFYWDTRHNKLITVFKALTSSGDISNESVKGKLHL